MRRVLTTLGAATMLIGLPLAAAADDDDRHRGWRGHDRQDHYQHPKHKHVHKHYYAPPVVYRSGPPVVYRPAPSVVYYPAPVVARPVYVPAPVPAPRPWPFNHVDVGFRIFF